MKKTASLDTAKDCVQEVFISIYHLKHELETTSSLKAYLYKALQNKIYNHYQKDLTRKQYENTASGHMKIVGNDVVEDYESKLLEQKIFETINQLPPKCRKVFLMSRKENLPYKEIAKQLNISINTVDQHIQKALRKLRGSMGGIFLVL